MMIGRPGRAWWWLAVAAALEAAAGGPHPARAEGTPSLGEEIPAEASAVASAKHARPAVIKRIAVEPVDGKTEIRIMGTGALSARISKADGDRKLILDFDRALYRAPRVALGAPGIGDITVVRGAQFKGAPVPVARVVVELATPVPYTESRTPGRFVLAMSTAGVAGPEEEGVSVPVEAAGAAPPLAPVTATETQDAAPAGGDAAASRATLLHAMTTDLPDRVRLVVTADGVLRYKLASVDGGRELQLSMAGVDLKWAKPSIELKEGPILSVRAAQVLKPVPQVRLIVRLRQPLPYHVRRDQNQVVIEVERPAEGEAVSEAAARGGDLLHRVTLNVHNEDLAALIKALAFEAGFDNVVINKSVATAAETVTISLRDVQVAKALNLVLAPKNLIWKVERGVLRVGTSPEFDAELEASALSGGGAAGADGKGSEEEGIVTRVFRMRYISLFEISAADSISQGGAVKTDVLAVVNTLLVSKTKGKVVVDERSNSLVVTDAASNMAKIGSVIRQLDVAVPQVHIQGRLILVNKDRTDQLGINWEAQKATPANPVLFGQGIPGGAPRADVRTIIPETPPWNLTTALLGPGFNLVATLEAMQTRGDIQTLLNPSITTLQDRISTVSIAETVSVPVQREVAGASGLTLIQDFVDLVAPTRLTVRPHVMPDNRISLEVHIEIASFSTGKGARPTVNSQSAKTRLIVKNRETGIIGGILTDRAIKNIQKFPVLGDLPWFLGGALFRNESVTMAKFEMVLFLTPTIADEI